jgi:hypothetical protein
MKVYFSDFFGVPRSKVEAYGAFDISLLSDLPLFVDPFLIFNSDKTSYQTLHRNIIRYLRFLRDKSANGALSKGLIGALYRFPEIRQNWLGFSASGSSGRGLGRKFAAALNANLNEVFADFGDEQITKDAHLEKLCLVTEGVGRDMISDFTNNLIQGFPAEYTEKFAKKHIADRFLKDFAIPRVSFNYATETWVTSTYRLPAHDGTYVLLTPTDMLTKDDTWINKTDLVADFSAIPDAIENEHLRAQINNYFRKLLPKKNVKKSDEEAAVRATLLHFPKLIDYYIKFKEDHGEQAEDISAEKVRESTQLYVDQFKAIVESLARHTDFYRVAGNTYDEAMQRVLFLKDVIENKGGHKLFYLGGEPLQREEDLHIAYRLTWFATPSDVSREVNDGRGPADFKVSRGAGDKSIVEFKLAKNSHLKQNLEHQSEIYQRASGASGSIKAILYFTRLELMRVQRILRELKLTGDASIVLIDARNDNKPPGSKAT